MAYRYLSLLCYIHYSGENSTNERVLEVVWSEQGDGCELVTSGVPSVALGEGIIRMRPVDGLSFTAFKYISWACEILCSTPFRPTTIYLKTNSLESQCRLISFTQSGQLRPAGLPTANAVIGPLINPQSNLVCE